MARQTLLRAIDLHRATSRSSSVLPKWIHLTPPGPTVKGRDGRGFTISDPDAVIAATELPAMIDLDHLSYFTGDTKAFGWVDRIEYEDGKGKRAAGFWGRIEHWTAGGKALVQGREYRFLSPVVHTLKESDDDELPELVSFDSFALTNRPNLTLEELSGMHSSQRRPQSSGQGHRTPKRKKPTAAELRARIAFLERDNARREAQLEAQTRRETEARELARSEFRAKFGLRDMTPEGQRRVQRGAHHRAAFCRQFGITTAEYDAQRAAFRRKFGLVDLSRGVPEKHTVSPGKRPAVVKPKGDARAEFRARFGLANLSNEGT